jgi:hypothetical protein
MMPLPSQHQSMNRSSSYRLSQQAVWVLILGSLFVAQQVQSLSFQPTTTTRGFGGALPVVSLSNSNKRPTALSAVAVSEVQENETTGLQRPASPAWASSVTSSPTPNFDSPLQFLDAVSQDSNNDNLIVVKYYAVFCKVCQRTSIKYKQVAMEKMQEPVEFYRLEASRLDSDTLRSLGVTKFPFVQIFRQGDCVASFSTGASNLFAKRVRDTLDVCLDRSDDEWQAFQRDFSKQVLENRQARAAVKESLLINANSSVTPSDDDDDDHANTNTGSLHP